MRSTLPLAAIVIPVHNEEEHLVSCLEAALAAAAAYGKNAFVVAVLDRCTDRSAAIAASYPVFLVSTDAGSVGAARAIGARAALVRGATWLAFTDADSTVAPDWLVAQSSLQAEAVCGTVSVSDWHEHDPQIRADYESEYMDADGHRHIHGANLGLSAAAYAACGGFENVGLDEDVGLVQRLLDAGITVAWSATPRVLTSARTVNRVAGGFGGCIQKLVVSHASKQTSDNRAA